MNLELIVDLSEVRGFQIHDFENYVDFTCTHLYVKLMRNIPIPTIKEKQVFLYHALPIYFSRLSNSVTKVLQHDAGILQHSLLGNQIVFFSIPLLMRTNKNSMQ